MIRLILPGLPPSTNHAYVTVRGNRRILSKEGEKYKKETVSTLSRQFPSEMQVFKPHVPMMVLVRFHCLSLTNAGWPKTAESRYKKFDVSNLAKLFEDCVKAAGGYDDSQNMFVGLQKLAGPVEQTEMYVWDLSVEVPTPEQWKEILPLGLYA